QQDRRAGHVGAGEAYRPANARRQTLAGRSRPRHALSRLLGACELGARDDAALSVRRAHVLSAAQLGQRRRRLGADGAESGNAAAGSRGARGKAAAATENRRGGVQIPGGGVGGSDRQALGATSRYRDRRRDWSPSG